MVSTLLTLIYACEDDSSLSTTVSESTETFFEKGNHPYSPENMAKAWNLIKEQYPEQTKDIHLTFPITHNYVRFTPKNNSEYEMINTDINFSISANSWLYEKNTGGEHAYSINNLNHFYAAVPVDYSLPSTVKYEILDAMFAPDLIKENNQYVARYGEKLIDVLIDQSYALLQSDYPIEIDNPFATISEKRGWKPGGRIRVKKVNALDGFHRAYVSMDGIRYNETRQVNVDGIFGNTGNDFNGAIRFNLIYTLSAPNEAFARTKRIKGPRQRRDWNYDINFNADMCPAYSDVFPSSWCD